MLHSAHYTDRLSPNKLLQKGLFAIAAAKKGLLEEIGKFKQAWSLFKDLTSDKLNLYKALIEESDKKLNTKVRLPAIKKAILDQNPDVCFLQELDPTLAKELKLDGYTLITHNVSKKQDLGILVKKNIKVDAEPDPKTDNPKFMIRKLKFKGVEIWRLQIPGSPTNPDCYSASKTFFNNWKIMSRRGQ